MFYLDVFPTRSFKIIGWIVFWYITINTLIIFLLTIFACTPVPAFWNRDLKGKVSWSVPGGVMDYVLTFKLSAWISRFVCGKEAVHVHTLT